MFTEKKEKDEKGAYIYIYNDKEDEKEAYIYIYNDKERGRRKKNEN